MNRISLFHETQSVCLTGGFRGVEFSFTFVKLMAELPRYYGEGWLVGDIYSMLWGYLRMIWSQENLKLSIYYENYYCHSITKLFVHCVGCMISRWLALSCGTSSGWVGWFLGLFGWFWCQNRLEMFFSKWCPFPQISCCNHICRSENRPIPLVSTVKLAVLSSSQ